MQLWQGSKGFSALDPTSSPMPKWPKSNDFGLVCQPTELLGDHVFPNLSVLEADAPVNRLSFGTPGFQDITQLRGFLGLVKPHGLLQSLKLT